LGEVGEFLCHVFVAESFFVAGGSGEVLSSLFSGLVDVFLVLVGLI